jgi:diacylglycerol O-acyltransferase / wax synthase
MDAPVEAHISPVDAFTLTLEKDPVLRATIVAVATFDRSPDWDVLVDRVDRATRLVPRFREKLIRPPFGVAPPRWVVDAEFDLSLHLRRIRLAEGAGFTGVLDLARAVGADAFDHDRPLWEFILVEGVEGSRACLVMKLHHALTDGVGGIEIAAHVVDLTEEPADLGPMPPAPAAREHGLLETTIDTTRFHVRRGLDAAGGLAGVADRNLRRVARDPVGAVTDGAATAAAVARFVRPVTSSDSHVLTGRRALRQPGVLDVPLGPLRAAAHSADAHLNDAFLAAVAGGMRRYHEQHCAPIERVRVSMPVNVRTDTDAPGGNRVTVERFELPVSIEDPAERMCRIAATCRALRRDPAIPYADQVAAVLNLLPVEFTAAMLRNVDLLTSNVPGFPDRVWVGGATLESFHVFGATLGSAANVTLMSYRDTCHIGINVDVGAVRDPDQFRACLAEGFDEVMAVA